MLFLYDMAFQAISITAVADAFPVGKTKTFNSRSDNRNSNAVSTPALRYYSCNKPTGKAPEQWQVTYFDTAQFWSIRRPFLEMLSDSWIVGLVSPLWLPFHHF